MRSILGFFCGLILWLMYRCTLLLLRLPPLSRNRPQAPKGQPDERHSGFRVLVTGRVDSNNWFKAHLLPLARTANISELLLVVDGDVCAVPKIRQFLVPKAIGWIRPRGVIRSAWVMAVALREKPDIVMPYSVFPPGLFGLLAARLSGAAAILQLPGGPFEIEAGGWVNDNIPLPAFLCRQLAPLCQTLCSHFDAVIVRGRKAKDYVRQHTRQSQVEIVAGSVDPNRYHLNGQPRTVDIVSIGRIVAFKQPDHICEIVRKVAQHRPSLRVIVAGRGPLLDHMKQQARQMGLASVIHFVGHVEKVEDLFVRSRIFILTSKSEGLSIALAEAMTAGVVPVVADVGDLSELVINGKTGWLIKPGDFEAYSERICALLDNQVSWFNMSTNARHIALENNSIASMTRRWGGYLDEIVAAHRGRANAAAPWHDFAD